ncbi:MAG: hypothetical protein NDJ89_10175 [Oligoflexia bacterium]|nr:hypothetical protein [Oligoflexia bacterium]
MRASFAILLGLCLLSACTERQYEDYGLSSDAELQLTPVSHPRGYGFADCFACHVHSNIHQVDGFNPVATEGARRATANGGIESCRGCHGSNGVSE